MAPHRDAASGMAGGDRGFSNACLHIGTRAWEKFRPDSGCDRLGGDDFPCPFQRAHQRIDVVALGSNAPVLGSARITAARDSLHQLRGDRRAEVPTRLDICLGRLTHHHDGLRGLYPPESGGDAVDGT